MLSPGLDTRTWVSLFCSVEQKAASKRCLVVNFKRLLYFLSPPIITRTYRNIRGYFEKDDLLFDGHETLFMEKVEGVSTYGEYGAGQSTMWMASNTNATVYSVDTSKEWVDKVNTAVENNTNVDLRWVDLGPVKNWGTPISYERREHIIDYVQSIWVREEKPSLVLVDGRFRVACFLYSLLHGEPGTQILFDDYNHRPHYHVVEECVKPTLQQGRHAYFVTPETFDRELASELLQRFLYVMD